MKRINKLNYSWSSSLGRVETIEEADLSINILTIFSLAKGMFQLNIFFFFTFPPRNLIFHKK